MSDGSSTPATDPVDLDLEDEARWFLRRQYRAAIVGFGLSVALIGVGGYALLQLPHANFVAGLIVAALLLLLGAGILLLTLRYGLLNPVRSIRLDPRGISYARRRRGTARRAWTKDGLILEADDVGTDASAGRPVTPHLLFSAPGSVYGSLSAADLGRIIDYARLRGASVGSRTVEIDRGKAGRRLRRVQLLGPERR